MGVLGRMGVFIVGALAVMVSACGAGAAPAAFQRGAAPDQAAENHRAFERQLAGHERRVAGCVDEARSRQSDASGIMRAEFTVSPEGYVARVEITRDTAADPALTDCVRSRLAGLFFDPAPALPAHRSLRFAFCESPEGMCHLGPAQPVAGAAASHRAEVEDLFRARRAEIAACHGAVDESAMAIAEVELTIGVDGRVMSGRILDEEPRGTPLANCALRPLLGAMVTAIPLEESFLFRSTIFLRPEDPGTTLAVQGP